MADNPVVSSYQPLSRFVGNAEIVNLAFKQPRFVQTFATDMEIREEFISTLLKVLSTSQSLSSSSELPRQVAEFLNGKLVWLHEYADHH